MIINGKTLLSAAPIADMLDHKAKAHGVSNGLAEVGYDIRIKQDVRFMPRNPRRAFAIAKASMSEGEAWRLEAAMLGTVAVDGDVALGQFALASSPDLFQMPADLVGVVHDKSTWARQGLGVFNTVIEPGWHGELVLELTYHGTEPLHIPAGAGIAQVIFHSITEPVEYTGKYQHQRGVTPAIMEGQA